MRECAHSIALTTRISFIFTQQKEVKNTRTRKEWTTGFENDFASVGGSNDAHKNLKLWNERNPNWTTKIWKENEEVEKRKNAVKLNEKQPYKQQHWILLLCDYAYWCGFFSFAPSIVRSLPLLLQYQTHLFDGTIRFSTCDVDIFIQQKSYVHTLQIMCLRTNEERMCAIPKSFNKKQPRWIFTPRNYELVLNI